MGRVIVLDSGPLGIVAHPHARPEAREWLGALVRSGATVVVPEIADYEVRRELIRASKTHSITHLDAFKATYYYLPLTTDTMLRAAEFWAQARNVGRPTAPPGELDADAILAAQAILLGGTPDEVIVATTNVGHLRLFVDARLWHEIV